MWKLLLFALNASVAATVQYTSPLPVTFETESGGAINCRTSAYFEGSRNLIPGQKLTKDRSTGVYPRGMAERVEVNLKGEAEGYFIRFPNTQIQACWIHASLVRALPKQSSPASQASQAAESSRSQNSVNIYSSTPHTENSFNSNQDKNCSSWVEKKINNSENVCALNGKALPNIALSSQVDFRRLNPKLLKILPCVNVGLKFPNQKYGFCEKDKNGDLVLNEKRGSQNRPCATEHLAMHTADALLEAARCVGFSEKELLSVCYHEGRLQTNAGGPTGDWGPCQVTGIGAKEVVRVIKRKSPTDVQSCNRFLVFKEQAESGKVSSSVCDRITPPDNPYRNFLMGAILLSDAKNLADDIIADYFLNLNQSDKTLLSRMLFRLMYNGGPGTVKLDMIAFLAQNPRMKKATLSEIEKEFKYFLNQKKYEKLDKNGKVVGVTIGAPYRNYNDHVNKSAEGLRTAGGLQCSV